VSEQKQFIQIKLENGTFETQETRKYALRKPYKKQDPRIIKAVIPGVVVEIPIKVGMPVSQGELLLILEAMKMLNRITAPQDGSIKSIHVKIGEKVAKGQLLIQLG
jgi:biotin carboxyl carrier protein